MYNTTQIRRLGFWQAAAVECLLRLGTSRGKMPEIILQEIVAALNVSHSAALRLGKAPTLTRKYSGRGPDGCERLVALAQCQLSTSLAGGTGTTATIAAAYAVAGERNLFLRRGSFSFDHLSLITRNNDVPLRTTSTKVALQLLTLVVAKG